MGLLLSVQESGFMHANHEVPANFEIEADAYS
jgi:hypothetical protein